MFLHCAQKVEICPQLKVDIWNQRMAHEGELRSDRFAGISVIKLMPKSYFCFFQPFPFSHSFFLDHHTTFGLSKTPISAPFSFSFSFLGNQRAIALCRRGKLGLSKIIFLHVSLVFFCLFVCLLFLFSPKQSLELIRSSHNISIEVIIIFVKTHDDQSFIFWREIEIVLFSKFRVFSLNVKRMG